MLKRLLKLGLLAGVLVAIWQSQALADWWQLRNYNPPADIAVLAQRASFTDGGRRLFYLAEPELNDKQGFNANCPAADRANVLGCYVPTSLFNQGRIYLLEVDRTELDGIEEVTAAHELLHAAYQRLAGRERGHVDALLKADFDKFAPADLKAKIELYNDDPALRLNEIHSFLGTEVAQLSPELENYYSRYFNDRGRVVALFEQYESVFKEIERKIAGLEAELKQLKDEITRLRAQIDAKRAELDSTRQQMEAMRAQGRIEEYNALAPVYNQMLREHNALVAEHNNKVALHNRKAEELNRLSLRQNDLAQSLDSQQPE